MPKDSGKPGEAFADEQKVRSEIGRIFAGRRQLDAETLNALQEFRRAKHLDGIQWQKLGSDLYEKKLLEHLDDGRLTEVERKYLDDLVKAFHLTQEQVLRIRRAHAPEAIEKSFRLASEDQYFSPEEKSELFQLGVYMGLTAEFVETFLAAQRKPRGR